jgi:hypothetical protein
MARSRHLSVRIAAQIQQHKENNHGQRTAKKKQGSKETKKETDSGDLSLSRAERTTVTGHSRSGAVFDFIHQVHNKSPVLA